MAYNKEEIETIFKKILNHISVDGMAIRNVLKLDGTPSNETFFKWLEEDEEKSKRYARACEERADLMFEDILHIADDTSRDTKTVDLGDGVEIETLNSEAIQRSRLRVDARKWALSKMNPKKYGDKIDLTTGGDKINTPKDYSNLSNEEMKTLSKLEQKASGLND